MSKKRTRRQDLLGTFLDDHPDGWQHGDWESLLAVLRRQELVAPGEEDEVGRQLERENVSRILGKLRVPGLGPKRREAVADGFPRRFDLTTASVEALSRLPAMNRSVAEAVVAALR